MSEYNFKYLVLNEDTPFEEINPLRDLSNNGTIQLEILHQLTIMIGLLEEIKNNSGR